MGSHPSQPVGRVPQTWRCRLPRAVVWVFVFLSCSIFAASLRARAPADFSLTVTCGSIAPWGSSQHLTVTPDGAVAYRYQSQANVPVSDSTFVTLNATQMEAIYDTLVAVNFFALDHLYDSGAADGTRVAMRAIASGNTHAVDARNTLVPELNRIVSTLNGILAPHGIELVYGMPEL